MTGPRIARALAMPRSTVGVVLRRLGLGRLKALDRPAPMVRYPRARPGELLHFDTKKLGRIDGVGHRITGQHSGMVKNRGIGWEVLHVCIDDASRLAYTELLPDETKESAIAFLDRALAWFAPLGVSVERVMTDNGSAYRSHAFRSRLKEAGIRHPTRRAPTVRPSASSKPACANGPMPAPTTPPPSEATPCSPGSPTTTTTDHTQPSVDNRPPQS